MNFFKRKGRRATTLTISDQTKSSKASLSSSDGKTSQQGSTGTLRKTTAEIDYHNSQTVEFKEDIPVKNTANGALKIKHTRFSDDANLNNNSSSWIRNGSDAMEERNGTYLGNHQSRDMGLLSRPGPNLTQDIPSEGPTSGAPMALYASVIKGDKAELKKIISAKPELLNTADNFGRTPLMYCVLADRLECAKFLINMGCDLDQVDNAGRSAIHSAAHKGSYKFLELLHHRGASLDIKDNDGQTALHLATRMRTSKCLEFLLRNLGAGKVDVPDNQMRTALHWSAAFNNTESVKLLIKSGINIAIPDGECKTPLHWAANNHDPSAVNTMAALLEKSPGVVNWQDCEGRTALHFAVAHGNSAAVKFLVNFKAMLRAEYSEPYECDTDRSDNTFRTPLHWAAQLGHTHIVKLLLQGNAKNSSSDGNGATPFLYAALTDKHNVVEAMIEHDSSVVDQVDIEGRNALMWAAGKGSNNVIRLLLGTKKSPQLDEAQQDSNGSAAVQAEKGQTLKFSPLDVNKLDNKGNTALHVAAWNGHASSVELLLSHGARHEQENQIHHTPIFGACEKGHVNCVKYLLDYNASTGIVDSENRTPLHWAALGGHAEVCELLIKEGVNVDVRDKLERTPLHCAAFGAFINCMNLLLENGADVDLQDQEGRSALHWAAQSGHLDAIKLLFQYSVFPNPMEYTEERLTPLDHALQKEKEDVLQYLIEQGALSAEHIRNIAAMRIQAYFRGYKVRRTKEILMKTLLLRKEKRKKEIEEKSAEQIRHTACTKIQACYRGYCIRKRRMKKESSEKPIPEPEPEPKEETERSCDPMPDVDSGAHSPEQEITQGIESTSQTILEHPAESNTALSHDEGVICDHVSVASSHSSDSKAKMDRADAEERKEKGNESDVVEDERHSKEEDTVEMQSQSFFNAPLPHMSECENEAKKPKKRLVKKGRPKRRSRPELPNSESSHVVRTRKASSSSSVMSLRSMTSSRKESSASTVTLRYGPAHLPAPPPQPNERRTRKKRLIKLKEPTTSENEYPGLDKIGNDNNIHGEKVRGIAYRTPTPDATFFYDELQLVPRCPIKTQDTNLELSEYIESLMALSPTERKLLTEHQNKRREAFRVARTAARVIQKTWWRYLQSRNPSLHRKFQNARKSASKQERAKKREKEKSRIQTPGTSVPERTELLHTDKENTNSTDEKETLHTKMLPKRSYGPTTSSSSVLSLSQSRSSRSEASRSSLMSSSEIGSSGTGRKSSKGRRSKTNSQSGSYISVEKLEELSRIYGHPKMVRDLLANTGRSNSSLPSINSSKYNATTRRPVTVSENTRSCFESGLRGTSAYTMKRVQAMHSPRTWSGLPGVQKNPRLTETPGTQSQPSPKSGLPNPNIDFRLLPLQWQKLYGELQDASAAEEKRRRAARFSYNVGEIS